LNGSGYPDGLVGDAIPLLARVVAVSDTYDAMTSDRPYRKGMAPEVAYKEITTHSGDLFDPAVVDAFVAAFRAGDLTPVVVVPTT
jgi:HD-GYP domain-containing protein (c-di-GMP phosphodiesterase class II)